MEKPKDTKRPLKDIAKERRLSKRLKRSLPSSSRKTTFQDPKDI